MRGDNVPHHGWWGEDAIIMNMNTTITGRVVRCDEVPLCGDRGFGLIELMMAMTIALFLVGALYSAYISQQRTKITQDQVAEMQRNARAALEVMTAEIRMAGRPVDLRTSRAV